MFFSLPNLSAQTARPMENPQDYRYPGVLPHKGNKIAFSEWSHQLTTEHSYLSMFEGLSSIVRVNDKDNPAFRVHGIIADYDQISLEFMLEIIKTCPPSEFMPTWFLKTHSGRCRLIWEFERAVSLMSKDHWNRFLRKVTKEFQFIKWHSGLDESALGTPSRYFEHGTDWERLPQGKPVPAALLSEWSFDSGIKCSTGHKKELVDIPMEDLAAETHARFPGRWKGEFKEGAQGVRFWDPSADNPTGAWIRKDGVYCFTGTQAFMPWREIFGKEFVAKYTQKMTDWIIEESAYDGTTFWVLNDNQDWVKVSKDDFGQSLRARGFGLTRVKGEVYQNDAIEYAVKTQRRVDCAMEFVYHPPGIKFWKGSTYLNTSRVKCLEPAAPMTAESMVFEDGIKHFPMIHKLLTALFVEEGNYSQLNHFLAWLKYFYVNALKLEPQQGQAIAIAGPAGVGKTFLTEQIIGGLAGGYVDGVKHLVEGERFTALLTKNPLIIIDDSSATVDYKTRTQFTSKIKKYVANPEIIRDEKHEKAAAVPLFGRFVILCNLDAASLSIIPNMEISVKDKISLFKTTTKVIDFSERRLNDHNIQQQLPNFARFLIDWVIPAECIPTEKRFGVKAYHHEYLLAESKLQGHSEIKEMLLDYFKVYAEQHKDEPRWVGKATKLHAQLNEYAKETIRGMTPRALGVHLANMEQSAEWIRGELTREGVKEWSISYDLMTALPKEKKK